jgi:hypothetical protein
MRNEPEIEKKASDELKTNVREMMRQEELRKMAERVQKERDAVNKKEEVKEPVKKTGVLEYTVGMENPQLERYDNADINIISKIQDVDRIEQIAEGKNTNEKHILELAEDISKNGIKHPVLIVYNSETGEVVLGEGNHRLQIAQILGLKTIPVKLDIGRGKNLNFKTLNIGKNLLKDSLNASFNKGKNVNKILTAIKNAKGKTEPMRYTPEQEKVRMENDIDLEISSFKNSFTKSVEEELNRINKDLKYYKKELKNKDLKQERIDELEEWIEDEAENGLIVSQILESINKTNNVSTLSDLVKEFDKEVGIKQSDKFLLNLKEDIEKIKKNRQENIEEFSKITGEKTKELINKIKQFRKEAPIENKSSFDNFKKMNKNDMWYSINDNYEMKVKTGNQVFEDTALEEYKYYREKGGKKIHDGLEELIAEKTIQPSHKAKKKLSPIKKAFLDNGLKHNINQVRLDNKNQIRTEIKELGMGYYIYNHQNKLGKDIDIKEKGYIEAPIDKMFELKTKEDLETYKDLTKNEQILKDNFAYKSLLDNGVKINDALVRIERIKSKVESGEDYTFKDKKLHDFLSQTIQDYDVDQVITKEKFDDSGIGEMLDAFDNVISSGENLGFDTKNIKDALENNRTVMQKEKFVGVIASNLDKNNPDILFKQPTQIATFADIMKSKMAFKKKLEKAKEMSEKVC